MAQAITGNTYPVKDQLRAMGGRWNPATKAWMVPDERAAEARALVGSAPRSNGGGGGRNWDPNQFRGYGAPRGGAARACKTDGNCSSIGSGRSCGGHDCDGY